MLIFIFAISNFLETFIHAQNNVKTECCDVTTKYYTNEIGNVLIFVSTLKAFFFCWTTNFLTRRRWGHSPKKLHYVVRKKGRCSRSAKCKSDTLFHYPFFFPDCSWSNFLFLKITQFRKMAPSPNATIVVVNSSVKRNQNWPS